MPARSRRSRRAVRGGVLSRATLPGLPLLLPGLLLPGLLAAQVNTEAMRQGGLPDGFHETVEFNATLVSGNSDFFRGTGGLRVDWRAGDLYTFGVIRYERGTEDRRSFIHKGFIHLRGIRRLNPRLSVEAFAQKEFDDFLLLRDRHLLGAGMRIDLIGTSTGHDPAGVLPSGPGAGSGPATLRAPRSTLRLHAGLGTMWENEDLDTAPRSETKFLRATNYISLRWDVDDRVRFGAVAYYQVRYRHAGDTRILLDTALDFDLTRSVAFRVGFDLRYDHEPPPGIEAYDLELTNGVRIAF